MSVMSVALLCFSCVAGGPFGIEVAVQAGGALPTIIALLGAGALWGLPQALITAELTAAIPANGGPVVWARRAFGDEASFVVTWLLLLNQWADIPLYSQLFTDYVTRLLPAEYARGALPVCIKLAVIAATMALNILGVEALEVSAALLTTLILAPFVLLPIAAAATGWTFHWDALGPRGIPGDATAHLALFLSTILWCMQGWSEIGFLAAEIAHPERVLPKGLLAAAGMVVVAYALPVVFGVAMAPDLSLWEDGFLLSLARDVAPWLAVAVLISAALANLSTFLLSLAAYARTLQAAAREGMVPGRRWLGRNMTRWRTPVPAICVMGAATAGLSFLEFEQLVVADR